MKTVRELLGVVVSEKASKGILVTSGRFTEEAKKFASANSEIDLVDGPKLAALIRDVQATSMSDPGSVPAETNFPPSAICPLCNAQMVLRTARKGQHAGSQFWGCSKYPGCKGTRRGGPNNGA